MDFFEEEIIRFLTCLNSNNVKYIIVGGFAVNLNGINRATMDLGIWLADIKENRTPFVNAPLEYALKVPKHFIRFHL